MRRQRQCPNVFKCGTKRLDSACYHMFGRVLAGLHLFDDTGDGNCNRYFELGVESRRVRHLIF
jgi:hypothetical protein